MSDIFVYVLISAWLTLVTSYKLYLVFIFTPFVLSNEYEVLSANNFSIISPVVGFVST